MSYKLDGIETAFVAKQVEVEGRNIATQWYCPCGWISETTIILTPTSKVTPSLRFHYTQCPDAQ